MSDRTIANFSSNKTLERYHGSAAVAAGQSVIIATLGFPGAIAVIGGETIAYMVNAVTDDTNTIIADDHTLFPLATSDYTASAIYSLTYGVCAYEISNTAGSDPITVNWRIIRP